MSVKNNTHQPPSHAPMPRPSGREVAQTGAGGWHTAIATVSGSRKRGVGGRRCSGRRRRGPRRCARPPGTSVCDGEVPSMRGRDGEVPLQARPPRPLVPLLARPTRAEVLFHARRNLSRRLQGALPYSRICGILPSSPATGPSVGAVSGRG